MCCLKYSRAVLARFSVPGADTFENELRGEEIALGLEFQRYQFITAGSTWQGREQREMDRRRKA